MQRYGIFVGGKRRDGECFDLIRSPFDGSEVGEAARGQEADLDAAIDAAARAFAQHRAFPTHARARLLEKVAIEIERRADELATLIAKESGKPIRYARGEVSRGATTFRLGASAALTLENTSLPIDLSPASEGRLCVVERVPRGPIAGIAPFNFPLNLVAHKVSPALAVGAPMVLKPPHQAPLTSHLLAEIIHEIGVPDGMLNVVHCEPKVAERLARDERIKVLSFTGSDSVGWKLKSLAPKKQVLLELGGNAPCIVDETVNLARVLPRIVESCWANAGQICIKAQRLIVASSIYDDFVGRFVELTKSTRVGDPMDPETVVGPLIEKRHVERVLGAISEARKAGARVLTGGEASGQLLEPTVLVDVKPEMAVHAGEIFGPVTTIEPFSSFEEALAKANASRFGIQASVFTNDVARALAAFRTLEYGGVLINDPTTFRVDSYPYGGTKDSGFGREGVKYAVEEFTEPRVLVMGAG
jgi:glyceraldehyde-3-phosphate dehydrogenase (NADP+)